MREVRKKQKNFYKFLKSLVIFSVVFIFIYIGAQPYVKSFNETLAVAVNYACDILVIINLVVIFLYYSKYGKVESFLKDIENELEEAKLVLVCKKMAKSKFDPKEFIDDTVEDKWYPEKDFHYIYFAEIEKVLISE